VVHEFLPRERRWLQHGANSHPDTYKVGSDGFPVAGDTVLAPWAMHTYDGLDYDPMLNSLVVAASPNHNPIRKERPKSKSDPIWIYDLKSHKWSIFADTGSKTPSHFFGAATAFDRVDGNFFICKAGLWQLNLLKQQLQKLGKSPNCLHRSMAFDSWRRSLYLFGSYQGTCNVLRIDVSLSPEETAEWEQLSPGGDPCPSYSSVPVAFDEKAGLFLLVANDSRYSPGGKPASSATFIYDPETNTYEELVGTKLPAINMNFMIAWDRIHEVFFLVTGNRRDGASVWALRLDRDYFKRHGQRTNS
jgi:hypothetical protein